MFDLDIPKAGGGRSRIFLHAGMHKTGTTYIQTVCGTNRENLRALGLDYPSDPKGYKHGHHGLNRAIRSESADTGPLLQWLRGIGDQGGDVLLSGEGFSHVNAAGLKLIKDALPDATIVPILYFREWTGGLFARWQARLKGGTRESFAEFMARSLASSFELDYVNYALMLDKFSEVFGRENTVALSYDNLVESKTDILSALLTGVVAVDLEGRELDLSGAKRNPSLSPEDIAIVRLRCILIGRSRDNGDSRFNLLSHKDEFYEAVPELASLSEYREVVTVDGSSQLFRNLERLLYDAYADRFANAADGRIFSRSIARDFPIVNLESWLLANAAAIPRFVEIAGQARKKRRTVSPGGDETGAGRRRARGDTSGDRPKLSASDKADRAARRAARWENKRPDGATSRSIS